MDIYEGDQYVLGGSIYTDPHTGAPILPMYKRTPYGLVLMPGVSYHCQHSVYYYEQRQEYERFRRCARYLFMKFEDEEDFGIWIGN
jgi:hypothetical protein